jgi:carboxyl-terminal processing protease
MNKPEGSHFNPYIKWPLLGLLILVTLSCNAVTGAMNSTAPVAITATGSSAPSSTPTEVPTSAVYIPPQCVGQAVATLSPAEVIAEPTPTLDANPPLTTQEQLKVFDELVAKINEVYLYPDFNGIDWKGLTTSERSKIKNGLDTETFYSEMVNLVSALNDDHSQFESPAMVTQAEAELAGNNEFVGIGVLALPMVPKGHVSVLSVFPDSSAEHGGIRPHDSILAVDGVPIVQDGVAHMDRVRGPECSAVVLTVQSPGGAPRDVPFIRSHIKAAEPIYAQLVHTTDGSRIGYIFLPTFFDETIQGQVRKALEDFGPLDGLILDNRMNGGGSSDVMEPILSYFASGTVGHFVSRKAERPLDITADPINNSQTVPLVVLVGEDTVSFGEIFSGILQDIGRAKVVGQTTLGNVETLHGYDFDDGSRVWVAEERFDPINSHANWEQQGIIPDVQAHADWDTFKFETDPAITAALKLLGHGQ